MNKDLSIPRGKHLGCPLDQPSMISKRGVRYWFAPYWVRDLNGTICRIRAIKNKNNDVDLYMISKDGRPSYIEGSIQREFHKWCLDQQIDCILLGVDLDDVISTDWQYV